MFWSKFPQSWHSLMDTPVPAIIETFKEMEWEAKERKRMEKRRGNK